MTFPDYDDETQIMHLPKLDGKTMELDKLPPAIQLKLKFSQAKQAALNNDFATAYKLSQELIKLAPENSNAWVYAALYSQNNVERLKYFSRAISLAPSKHSARIGAYETMREHFDGNPYVRYLGQDDFMYQVMTADGQIIPIPKVRPPKYMDTPPDNARMQAAGKWLINAVLTLPFGGFIALICSSIAGFNVVRELREKSQLTQRRRLWLMLLQITIIWLAALTISYIFFLHLFSM